MAREWHTNDTLAKRGCPDTANGCGRRECGMWGCKERQRAHFEATAAAAQQQQQEDQRPVGMAGGVTLQPVVGKRGPISEYVLHNARAHYVTENPTQVIVDDPSPEAAEAYATRRDEALVADFMALAGSHMATTKVLARLVRASRSALHALDPWGQLRGPPGGH